MPLSRGAKIALTIAGGVAVYAWIQESKAKPADVVVNPPDNTIHDPDPPPPPPAPQNLCDYVGCPGFKPAAGAAWTPTYVGVRLQQLGYNINPAAPGWTILSDSSRAKILHFQQNYNHVAPTMSPKGPYIAEDGLAGNATIAAIVRASNEALKRIQSWAVIVSLTP